LVILAIFANQALGQYTNFEAQQTRPICLSPDGSRLFAVNTPDGQLSVFDVSNPANSTPVLIREIPVGVEPVSVNVVSNDEAWVVNEVSDSVSVVSVATGSVTATLAAKDEPADVVFANGRAFVSCSQNNLLRVFDLATRAELATIPLAGLNPRSLAVSSDGTKVYAAFKLSGNRTTLLPASLAPAQPPPTNGSLPAPPQVGLIVSADDPRLSPAPNMPDNDVAEINTTSLTVTRYFPGTGTVNFFVAVRPASNELWVANTEARNLTRFEPALKGHSVDNRVTRVNTFGAGTVTPFDLNPGVDYLLFPNNAARATALAQPTAIAFSTEAASCWGWISARAPLPTLPMPRGVLHASMIKASVTSSSLGPSGRFLGVARRLGAHRRRRRWASICRGGAGLRSNSVKTSYPRAGPAFLTCDQQINGDRVRHAC
jgi:YVTN family beta-propeller protein